MAENVPPDDEEKRVASYSIDRRQEARSSKYDLPIQYHEDALKLIMLGEPKRVTVGVHSFLEQPTGSVYSKRERSTFESRPRSSAFKNLKTDRLVQSLKGRPFFEFLKIMTIRKLKSDVYKQLNVLGNAIVCESSKPWPPEDMPSQIFCWSLEDFNLRREFKNVVWIDVLLRDRTEKCLHYYKYITDTDQLNKYLNIIFEGFLTINFDFDYQNDLINIIDGIYKFLEIYKDLIIEFQEAERLFQQQCSSVLAATFKKRESKTVYKQLLEERRTLMEFMDPIEVRYQLRYYDNKATQVELKIGQLEESYSKEIAVLKEEMQRDNFCSQCACNSLYIDVENYKNRTTLLTEQYDREYDAIDNKIQFNRLAVEKIRDQRRFMEEQVERFHEEIELMEARTIAEKAAEERKIMERLEAERLENEEREKKKKQKKNKKKDKK